MKPSIVALLFIASAPVWAQIAATPRPTATPLPGHNHNPPRAGSLLGSPAAGSLLSRPAAGSLTSSPRAVQNTFGIVDQSTTEIGRDSARERRRARRQAR